MIFFVWNANLIIYKENIFFVIISVKNRVFIQVKNLTVKTPSNKIFLKISFTFFFQNYVFFMNGKQIKLKIILDFFVNFKISFKFDRCDL